MSNESPLENNNKHQEKTPSFLEVQKVIGGVLIDRLKELNQDKWSARRTPPEHKTVHSDDATYEDITKTQKALTEINGGQSFSDDDCLSDASLEIIRQSLDKYLKRYNLELEKAYYPKPEGSMGSREIDDTVDKQFLYQEKIRNTKSAIHFISTYK